MSMSERSGSPFAFEIHVVESDADLGDTSCTLYTAANCGHFTVHRLIFQMTARRLVILPVLFRNLLHLLGRRSGTPFSVVLCVYQTAGVRLTLRLGFAAYVHSDVGVSGGGRRVWSWIQRPIRSRLGPSVASSRSEAIRT